MKTSPGLSASSSPPIEQPVAVVKPKSSKNRRQKRKSLQINQELLFAQLTEQLRAAKLPNATTSSAMSIRSRCSSAPQSEHGGFDDDADRRKFLAEFAREQLSKTVENDDEEEENLVDWDEPERPDDGKPIDSISTNRLFFALMTQHADESRFAFLFFSSSTRRARAGVRVERFSSYLLRDEKTKFFSFRFRCLCRTNRRIQRTSSRPDGDDENER